MVTWIDRWRRWSVISITLIGLTLLLGRGAPPAEDLTEDLDRLTSGQAFDFFTWELQALAQKTVYGLLAPHRFVTDEQQSRFVLDYLDDVQEARRLADEIDRIYTDPEIDDAEAASAEAQEEFSLVRDRMARHGPIAEMILEKQVSAILAGAGLGRAKTILPPVSGTFTPLPHILIVSPRSRIESVYQQQLIAGLTAAEQSAIEEQVAKELPDYSPYVTNIGGLAAYPSMLLESSSIDWVTDVVAHEWVHHYLVFHPLGWYYMRNGETRAINETTASLVGDWAGQEVILRYYAPLLARGKNLPEPLVVAEAGEGGVEEGFDFRAEMHHTRVIVDSMLAEGRIDEAEWYMEVRRRYFVANGYQIRKLNQAYFAFHGAYASTPGGAAGSDPIGPLVREAWAVSASPAAFLRDIAPIVTLQDLRDATAPS